MSEALLPALLARVLRDAHRYVPGLEQQRPTIVPRSPARRRAILAREVTRDAAERALARAGLARRHFDPEASAARLARVVELADGLQATWDALGDERSRRQLLDVLELRVLGPHHAPLSITPQAFRAHQEAVDRDLRQEAATFEVADPFFSPLSRYRVPVAGGGVVELHSHSVDVVSVYVLDQYRYGAEVGAGPGDVVLDVGGCWGDTALHFAARVGPSGRVLTFEPDPENLRIMRVNLGLNPELAQRITVVERALWHTAGQALPFTPGGRMTSMVHGDPATADHEAVTTTLDDAVAEAGLDRVDLIKMDVEGAEPDVLAGAQATLRDHAPQVALAAYHRDDDLVRLPELLPPGYRLFLATASPVEEETVLFGTSGGAGQQPEQ